VVRDNAWVLGTPEMMHDEVSVALSIRERNMDFVVALPVRLLATDEPSYGNQFHRVGEQKGFALLYVRGPLFHVSGLGFALRTVAVRG
jgi:hypothetical protein